MQLREKILAGGLVAAIVIWQLRPMFVDMFMEPLTLEQDRISNLNKQIKDYEVEEFQLMRANSDIGKAKQRSLPSNPLDAQRLYQRWITDLVNQFEFQDPKITPDRRVNKKNTFVQIRVAVEARATMTQLKNFLEFFHQVDLLHRIATLNIESQGVYPESTLAFSMIAEGLSFPSGPTTNPMFEQTTLAHEIDTEAKELVLASATALPNNLPLVVRVGNEFMNVTEIEKNTWTVERGQWGTEPQTHSAEAEVEAFPLLAEEGPDDVLLAISPFAKPLPPKQYDPSIAKVDDQTVTRGDTLKLDLNVDDWDDNWGSPVFSLFDEFPGEITLDANTGEMTLTAPMESEQTEFEFNVFVTAERNPQIDLFSNFFVKVRDKNSPPVLNSVEPVVAYKGQPFTLSVTGSDPDEDEKLTYSLGKKPAEDIVIDSQTGEINWTPPAEFAAGPQELEIILSDDGSPALTATQTVTIDVREDLASHTFLVGIISRNGERTAWLRDRYSNKQYRVNVGDLFQVANFQAMVTEMNYNELTLASGDALYRLSMDNNLRSAERLPDPPKIDEPKSEMTEAEAEIKEPANASEADDLPAEPPIAVPDEETKTSDGSSEG